ncbi:hypothetical protein HYPSUDRAFT_197926 [Hypholoma sublateritium FD-334 SS-4]|uniref:Tyrosine specific protein phosphatases domain-containing protein n=1 Tax=Hypholoma sublateritium (strain FD-334 SS-4) TaxID=945553 RepID=A0A0D2Q7S9_HYPSF|nr:hypothetical protein HYPSUDRAFT_197926 [Hypholoma sublateritium FD-334 SS-4]
MADDERVRASRAAAAAPAHRAQLQRLASQHHASEYSRAKFGVHGAPVRYTPLSLHAPDHFAQLRARQTANAQLRAWWPAPRPAASPPVSLHDEIMAAMAEPLQRSSQAPLKTSLTHPINISCIIPADLVDLMSSHALLSPAAPTLLDIPPPFTLDRLSVVRDARFQMPPPPYFFAKQTHFRTRSDVTDALQAAISSGMDSGANREPRVSVSLSMSIPTLPMDPTIRPPNNIFRPPTRDPSLFTIGNLFLSSCPGKKVRLDGPVKGRSGVRRDVETDMRRMKELGVGCIVCCLDDAELDFLGAPWAEYELAARRTGLDVLRLPIPEGLPPLSAPALDAHLTALIARYTLRGTPVLVHCRGGVGRAGVVACCWLVRLGLCGWPLPPPPLPPPPPPSLDTPPLSMHPPSPPAARAAVVAFVERVVALVRRRRSIKALETYEQVRFVVEYVEYLQRGAAAAGTEAGVSVGAEALVPVPSPAILTSGA